MQLSKFPNIQYKIMLFLKYRFIVIIILWALYTFLRILLTSFSCQNFWDYKIIFLLLEQFHYSISFVLINQHNSFVFVKNYQQQIRRTWSLENIFYVYFLYTTDFFLLENWSFSIEIIFSFETINYHLKINCWSTFFRFAAVHLNLF